MTTWNKPRIYNAICNIIEKQGYVTTMQVREKCLTFFTDPMTGKIIRRKLLGQKTSNRRLRELADLNFIASEKAGKTWRWCPLVAVKEIRKFVKSLD